MSTIFWFISRLLLLLSLDIYLFSECNKNPLPWNSAFVYSERYARIDDFYSWFCLSECTNLRNELL